jgi:ADP-heptose:LPS heptosyltransferase
MIGDVLLTTPAVYTLRRSFPDAHITYLTGRPARDVLLNNPDIDEIFVYDHSIFQKIVGMEPYDLTINFDGGELSDALCVISGARYRIGLNEKGTLKLNNVYNISPIKLSPEHNVIDSFLNLTRSLGLRDRTRNTRFYLTKEEKDFAKIYLKEHDLDRQEIIGIHPGGHGQESLWGAENFAKLSDEIVKNFSFTILIFQGPGEEDVATDMYKRIEQKDQSFLAPIFTLRKYASIVNRCRMFIANDGGPMHISASLGVKTVGISPSLAFPYWFPYKERGGCIYLQRNSISDISVEEVLKEVKTLLFGFFSQKCKRKLHDYKSTR